MFIVTVDCKELLQWLPSLPVQCQLIRLITYINIYNDLKFVPCLRNKYLMLDQKVLSA